MAYKARTLRAAPNLTKSTEGIAPPREVAGVLVPSRLTTLPGDPPAEMLADNLIDVRGVTGKPWPRSSADRNAIGNGAHLMRIRAEDGKWPTKQEKAAQVVAEKKLANPEGVARFLLSEQGVEEKEIKKAIARMNRVTANIPDLSDVPDTPEPSKRTRKSA